MRTIQPGSTGRSVYLRALDSGDGTPETGIAYNTSGISLWYRRDGAAAVTITPANLAALTTAWTSGGVKHVGEGVFRLDVPDAAFAAGAETVVIGGSATGMVFTFVEISLVGTPIAIRAGVLAGGGSTTATLDAGASSGNDFYIGNRIDVVGGTGAGQSRIIVGYVGSTKVATVDKAWGTNPGNGSVYAIHGQGIYGMAEVDVRAAVWNATAASYDTAGTTGEKLNDAGAAGSPPTTSEITTALLAATVATGTTLSDVMRLVLAGFSGKVIVSGSTITFRNIEDTKDALVITVNGSNERTAVTRSLAQ